MCSMFLCVSKKTEQKILIKISAYSVGNGQGFKPPRRFQPVKINLTNH